MKEISKEEVLKYHEGGKIEIKCKTKLDTPYDLSVAYSPGVAKASLEIQANPDASFLYTARKNLVAVITNGTAVLGLGDIGALAGKPVMEGKAALFKKFADVDSIDIEIDEKDPEEFVQIVKKIAISFGGINLEDIKSPECFYIEKRLREELSIPLMHDDQHGTAITVLAAMINALELAGKKPSDVKMVVNGAGAAAISCTKLCKSYGIQNIYMLDIDGILTIDRTDLAENQKEFARETDAKNLADLLKGADVVLGLSVADQISAEMVASMADNPIIFAMANPNPEIMPDVAHSVRDDIIMGTCRSDFDNQINNVLCFPYIFRASLVVRATDITEGMKLAASKAIAALAKEEVPKEICEIYKKDLTFSKDYIIPTPFDKRLLAFVAPSVAQAAINDGVNMVDLDIEEYKKYCKKLSDNI
jgi:malate dehydrogenase (oxaloacetate-decarboxylating)(NADP+)